MFALNFAILLMCVWARDTMGDTERLKECVKGTVFTTPIKLDSTNFFFEKALNINFKFIKNFSDITLTRNGIQPSVSTKII
jgi:hypothetical protein